MTMASDGRIVVTFGAVQAASADCGTVANQMNQQLDDLKSYLNPLVGSWTGQAAEQYRALEAQWERSASDLTAVLTQIQKALDNAYQNYAATEAANAKLWS
jgi:early secretory antigenic target protein ESAT-6